MTKRVACVMTDLFEDSEYTEPANAFREAGHEVVTIEKAKDNVVTGKQGETKVSIDFSIDEVEPAEYDALFIPGGFSPDLLRADDRFVHFAKHFMDESKPVFAICHGPQLLLAAKTLEGRDATGYKSIRVDMEYAGVKYRDDEVVVCKEQLVTSRHPGDLPSFINEALKLLNK